MKRTFHPLIPALLAAMTLAPATLAQDSHSSQQADFQVQTFTEGLEHPWALAFLPDGRMLVTERPGRLRILERDGTLTPEPVPGAPEVAARGQGGLLDVALHPDFESNRLIYLSHSIFGENGMTTAVSRARFENNRLEGLERIFTAEPFSGTTRHFGSRLAFDRDGYLFITVGDRGEKDRAQDIDDHAGSLIRLHGDGSIPEDNPFVGQEDARPEIFSYGHRNPQGLALHPETGVLWEHEHGPRGGDEVNIPRKGLNYGWPVITYGMAYSGGTIGEGTEKEGMEQPLHYWTPSIAPSGMAFYDGDRFPEWRGDLFVGALAMTHLTRLEIEGEEIVDEERLLEERGQRIRAVRSGPEGCLYVVIDDSDAEILRLVPAE
ncbi:PQQ-dependent sugar dehydrogenase [Fodinicurvata fenggangensis]|uniref:PQQ-dependent sugar dehydrogenase n=1 Tax=Fodinicurvata fenggangensis TaxID=1121830 RepID=UPI00047CE190|nr:PQQ-dependent sugar dehydrogenase [Fodinicurvata fenggangensis]